MEVGFCAKYDISECFDKIMVLILVLVEVGFCVLQENWNIP